jgi:hypothetical protein
MMNMGTPSKNSQYDAETPYQKRKCRFQKKQGVLLMKQPSVDQYASYPPQSTSQLRLDMAITHLLINCNLPFSLVKNPAFQQFMNIVHPRVIVRNERTYSRNKLPILYGNVKMHVDTILARELPNCSKMGFTADFWKCRTNQQYLNVSIHYVNDKFELHHFCLEFKVWQAQESPAKIAIGLKDIIDGIAYSNYVNIPLPKKTVDPEDAQASEDEATDLVFIFPHTLQENVVVVDGDHKMQAGLNQCQGVDDQQVCVCHKLETALKKSFDPHKLNAKGTKKKPAHAQRRPEDVIVALDKAKSLAGRLHQSSVLNEIVSKAAKKLNGKIHLFL